MGPCHNDRRIDTDVVEANGFRRQSCRNRHVNMVADEHCCHCWISADSLPATSKRHWGSSRDVEPDTRHRRSPIDAPPKTLQGRDLSGTRLLYLSVDGIRLRIRLGVKLYLLVMIGVRTDSRVELVALTDGYRESTSIPGSSAAQLKPARRGRSRPHGR